MENKKRHQCRILGRSCKFMIKPANLWEKMAMQKQWGEDYPSAELIEHDID